MSFSVKFPNQLKGNDLCVVISIRQFYFADLPCEGWQFDKGLNNIIFDQHLERIFHGFLHWTEFDPEVISNF